jgi:hypothetical protein
MPKQKSMAQLQKEVDTFNENIPVGSVVNVTLDDGSVIQDIVYHKATIMGGHTAMAWLETKGSYLLERVKPID